MAANNDFSIERVKTGIPGLDSMLYGGIPRENQVVLAGGPGVGKTLLGFEMLYQNALLGTKCAYITFEEQYQSLIRNVKEAFPTFTKIDELIENRTIIVGGQNIYESLQAPDASNAYTFANIMAGIDELVKTNDATFVVVDSISVLKFILSDKFTYRRSMLALADGLRRSNITAIFTVEAQSSNINTLKFQDVFFVFDGLVLMYQIEKEDRRTLNIEILKMRGTNHSNFTAPYEITRDGFKIYTADD